MSDALREAVKQKLRDGGWIDVTDNSPDEEWDDVADRAVAAVMEADTRRVQLEAIVRALASEDPEIPVVGPKLTTDLRCRHCGAVGVGIQATGHEPSCVWRLARELMAHG